MGKVIQFPVSRRETPEPVQRASAASTRLFDLWFAMFDAYAGLWRGPARRPAASPRPVLIEVRRESGGLG